MLDEESIQSLWCISQGYDPLTDEGKILIKLRFEGIKHEDVSYLSYDKDVITKQMNFLEQHWDQERGHIEADRILCELLTHLGYGDIVTAYNEIGKWYA